MNPRELSSDLSVAPQLAAHDIPALRAAGFRSIICNRPDGEDADQPSFDVIAKLALDHGLQARHLPVSPGQITHQHATAFAALLEELPKPVVAYCRSGVLAASLWAASQLSVPVQA